VQRTDGSRPRSEQIKVRSIGSIAHNVELRQIRYFVAVAEELHFGRAATRLFMAQPAVSQSLQTLEHALGVLLVNRTSRKVELTDAGEELLHAAQELLPLFERRLADVRRVGNGRQGSLRLGIATAAQTSFTGLIIRTFEARFPRIELELCALDWADQSLALHRGEVEASIVLLPIADPTLELETIVTESRVAVVSADHRLARRESVSIDELRDDHIVAPRYVAPAFLEWWVVNPRPGGSEVSYGPTVASFTEALQHVAQNHGVHIAAASAAEFCRRPDIAIIPVRDIGPASVALAWRKAGESSPVLGLRDIVRECRADRTKLSVA
jgi:DNA-binding transcriptional LysR family regulator